MNPHVIINAFLEHLFKCVVALNTANDNDNDNKTLKNAASFLCKLSTQFIETHQALILKDTFNRIKATGLIQHLENKSPAKETKKLSKLKRKISPPKETEQRPTKKISHTALNLSSDNATETEADHPQSPEKTAFNDLSSNDNIPLITRPKLRLTPSVTNLGIFLPPTPPSNPPESPKNNLAPQK